MRLFKTILVAALVCVSALALVTQSAQARRLGGPLNMVATVRAQDNYYLDVSLVQDEAATVTVAGNGASTLELFIYDSDGHMTGWKPATLTGKRPPSTFIGAASSKFMCAIWACATTPSR